MMERYKGKVGEGHMMSFRCFGRPNFCLPKFPLRLTRGYLDKRRLDRSNHVPILQNGKLLKSDLRPFNFKTMLLCHQGFKDLIRGWWSQFQVRGKPG